MEEQAATVKYVPPPKREGTIILPMPESVASAVTFANLYIALRGAFLKDYCDGRLV